jgi:hypothetical protein
VCRFVSDYLLCPVAYESIFVQVPGSFDCHSFVIYFEDWECDVFNLGFFFLFPQDPFGVECVGLCL